MYLYIYVYIFMYIYIHTCILMHMHTHTNTHTHKNTPKTCFFLAHTHIISLVFFAGSGFDQHFRYSYSFCIRSCPCLAHLHLLLPGFFCPTNVFCMSYVSSLSAYGACLCFRCVVMVPAFVFVVWLWCLPLLSLYVRACGCHF